MSMASWLIAYIIVCISLTAVSVLLILRCKKYLHIINNYIMLIDNKNTIIEHLNQTVQQWKSRVVDLEDAIKKEYGLTTRIEKTEINCEFNKLEMAVFQAGISNLISKPNLNMEDAQFYINLIRKIADILPKMEDPVATSKPDNHTS
jgi:hypothetical protein